MSKGIYIRIKDVWNKGKFLSEEHKRKLKLSRIGKTPTLGKHWKIKDTSKMKGHKVSEETRRKISEYRKNKHLSEVTKRKIGLANSFALKGRCLSEETKRKMRTYAIKRIKEDGKMICVGKNEKQILDEFEKNIGYKILRHYQIIGYELDGYIPALNKAIEVDEPRHFKPKQIIKDIQRENRIKEELGCTFLRINEQKFLNENLENENTETQITA